MNRTRKYMKKHPRFMTTMMILRGLRAERPIVKERVRSELNAMLEKGEVVEVVQHYYVLKKSMQACLDTHLQELREYLLKYGQATRRRLVNDMHMSAAMLNWILARHGDKLRVWTGPRGRLLIDLPLGERERLAETSHELGGRVLERLKQTKICKDSVVNLAKALGESKENILKSVEQLLQSGVVALQKGLIPVLLYVGVPAAVADAPVMEQVQVPAPVQANIPMVAEAEEVVLPATEVAAAPAMAQEAAAVEEPEEVEVHVAPIPIFSEAALPGMQVASAGQEMSRDMAMLPAVDPPPAWLFTPQEAHDDQPPFPACANRRNAPRRVGPTRRVLNARRPRGVGGNAIAAHNTRSQKVSQVQPIRRHLCDALCRRGHADSGVLRPRHQDHQRHLHQSPGKRRRVDGYGPDGSKCHVASAQQYSYSHHRKRPRRPGSQFAARTKGAGFA